MRLASSLALVCLLGLPTPGLAQSASGSSGPIFVTAGGFAAIEKSSTMSGLGVAEPDGTRTVGGGTAGVGVHLTEHVTARVEWSMTGTSKQRGDTVDYPYHAPATWTLLTAAFVTAPPVPQGLVTYTLETRRSTRAGYALLGYHLPAGTVSVELLAGVGILNETFESRRDVGITNLPAGLSLPALADYETSSYGVVPVLGADVAIALGRHAAVVPQVRVHAYTDRVSIRPGLAVRWTF